MNIETLMNEYFKEKSILKKLITNGLCDKCSKVYELLDSNNAKKGNENYLMVLFDEIPSCTLNIEQKNPHISNSLFAHYLYTRIETEYHHSKHNIDKDVYFCFDCMSVIKVEDIEHMYASVLEFYKFNDSIYTVSGRMDYIIQKYKKCFIDKMNSTNESFLKDFDSKKQKDLLKVIIINDFFGYLESVKSNHSNDELIEVINDFQDIVNEEL